MGWKTQILKQREKEKKNKEKELKKAGQANGENKCINCIHAYLMQSGKYNPIVSECQLNHDREVANMYICNHGFESSSGTTPVIHEMIPAPMFV